MVDRIYVSCRFCLQELLNKRRWNVSILWGRFCNAWKLKDFSVPKSCQTKEELIRVLEIKRRRFFHLQRLRKKKKLDSFILNAWKSKDVDSFVFCPQRLRNKKPRFASFVPSAWKSKYIDPRLSSPTLGNWNTKIYVFHPQQLEIKRRKFKFFVPNAWESRNVDSYLSIFWKSNNVDSHLSFTIRLIFNNFHKTKLFNNETKNYLIFNFRSIFARKIIP